MSTKFFKQSQTPGMSERADVLALKMMADVLTNGTIVTVGVGAGGTGYVAGDEVTLAASGDVPIWDARIEVVSEAAGVVTAVRITSCGAYSTLPDETGGPHATTGGTGTGLTVDVTGEGPYDAAPNAGGSAYVVGDVLTLNSGTLFGGSVHHQFVVLTVSTGAVTGVAPLRIGRYDVQPDLVGGATTGGTGTGCTLDLTKVGWTFEGDNAETFGNDEDRPQSWIAVGSNTAGLDPVIGAKVLDLAANSQIGLMCATSYDNGQPFETQPGTSSTVNFTTDTVIEGGPRICTAASGTFTLYAQISQRKALWVFDSSPSFEMGYQGLFTPFIDSPATKWPLPMVCSGTTAAGDVQISDAFKSGANSDDYHCSLMRTPENETAGVGTAQMRDLIGAWRNIGQTSAPIRLWPLSGAPQNRDEPPNIDTGSGTVPWSTVGEAEMVDPGGIATDTTTSMYGGLSTANGRLAPSPFGAGGQDLYYMNPPILFRDEPGATELLGELEGVFYINAIGLAARDRIEDADGNIFTVLPDTTSSSKTRFMAIRENG